MSQLSEAFRRRARQVTSRLAFSDDAYAKALALMIARSYISLARTEEWLEGGVSPVGDTHVSGSPVNEFVAAMSDRCMDPGHRMRARIGRRCSDGDCTQSARQERVTQSV